jgi:serine/threonine protein kinase
MSGTDPARELFERAAALPPEERRRLLDEARGSSPDAVSEVESLLRFHERRGAILDRHPVVGELPPASSSFSSSFSDVPLSGNPGPVELPRRLGAYTLHRELGAGGMGVVYEAEQESPKRTVAVKVIRPGLVSGPMLKRFAQEAAVLARLQHPGIAQVFEAGVARGQGWSQPFIAMELVTGTTITDFATQHNFSTRNRLDLFARVCDAVEHAHRRGVVHRDLKPGNIIVNAEGEPKILDFGVARLTDADAKITTISTNVGQIIGTLSYMSPEQAAGNPIDVDERSDVYALGVLLYELLCGRLPLEIDGRPVHQALRAISGDEPRPLSSHDRRLRGDLDTIARHGLEKDKQRRYQHAADLAADVRRFLTHQPITARPPSALYQIGKFTRRNRGLVVACAAAFVALAIGLVATLDQAARARAQAHRATDAAAYANEIADFMNKMFLSIEPDRALGREVTVKEVLDQAAATLENSSDKRPAVRAGLHANLAGAYVALGRFDEAAEHAQAAVGLYEESRGRESREWLSSVATLAQVLYEKNDFAGSERVSREGYDVAARILGKDERLLRRLTTALAIAADLTGKSDEAEKLYRQDIESARRVDGENSSSYISGMSNLGVFLMDRQRFPEALEWISKSEAAARRYMPADHPQLLISCANLGAIYSMLKRYPESEKYSREAVEISTRLLGENHADTLQYTANLANSIYDQDRLDEADAIAAPLVERCRTHVGEDDRRTAEALVILSKIREKQGRSSEAYTLGVEGYKKMTAVYGTAHLPARKVAAFIAEVCAALGRSEEAFEWDAKSFPPEDKPPSSPP